MAVKTPADLVSLRHARSVQTFTPSGLIEVWDGGDFTPITAITATRRQTSNPDHQMLSVEARGGVVEVTAHHHMLDADREQIRADELDEGEELALWEDLEVPDSPSWTVISPELAELLGLLVADGYVERTGRTICFTNNDDALRARVAELWSRCFLGSSHDWDGVSGWDRSKPVGKLNLTGVPGIALWLRDQLYTKTGHKQVPPLVLNAGGDVQDTFLTGYYAGDGLKRGKGDSVKTNSPVLAQGLWWLYQSFDRPSSVYVEHRAGKAYYQLNVPSAALVGGKGAHLRKNPAEVRRVVPVEGSEWIFDLETESGVFAAGVGRLVVHNSPRRGLEFVTRKVTHAAAAIKLGLADQLALGNLDAERDWGYAADYVEAMWLMLQQDEPEDYVIATGESHSVRELVDVAFDQVGLDPAGYVRKDERYMRPAEVDHLVGDYGKAREKLGWGPKTSFEELIRLMVDADLELLQRGVPTKQSG